jgi:hypothetical protein
VDGDQEALGVEAVHLDQPVVVESGAVDDEEHEVVVLVDLRPPPEMLGVLDRERGWNSKTSRRISKSSLSGWWRSSQKNSPLASTRSAVLRLNAIVLLPP